MRARTFIFVHKNSGSRFVFVNLDLAMTMLAMKLEVVERIKTRYPDLASLYTMDNVMLAGTHTHAGPGGFSWYALYDITTFGFDREHFDFIVDSIVKGILLAHDRLSAGGRILINTGLLEGASINRAPQAYMANPSVERERYLKVGNDTDNLMTVLRLQDDQDKELGMISWFSVHCTSMNNTNKLISGDNKGYASYVFEKAMNGNALPGTGPFVAAFTQSNEGDVSPNTRGPSCPDGSPCDDNYTCKGKTKDCIAKGPGIDMFDSTRIIGQLQSDKAMELYKNAREVISGAINFRHTFVEMRNVTVSPEYTGTGSIGKVCSSAMGYSFAAGTIDGPGDFNFKQGTNTSNPFWNFISRFISKPTPEQIACHLPKPILLNVGDTKPIEWLPGTLPIQSVVFGKKLALLAVPGEFTTMSGRRLRERFNNTLARFGRADNGTHVVITGLANAYSGYVTTFEEYQKQRYEAASTVFGPHTLAAYMQEFDKLAIAIGKDLPVPPGPTPRNLSSDQHSFIPPVIVDTHPIGKKFGDIRTDVDKEYKIGDTVRVEFWSAHPKNDYMTEKSFLLVEREVSKDNWQVYATDGDWSTKFHWRRHGISQSVATMEWEIEENTPPGTYRIRNFGNAKSLFGKITPFSGSSSSFNVVK